LVQIFSSPPCSQTPSIHKISDLFQSSNWVLPGIRITTTIHTIHKSYTQYTSHIHTVTDTTQNNTTAVNYEECSLLGCYAVWFSLRIVLRLLVTGNVVPSAPIFVPLMMEEIRSSETLVLTRTTRCNFSEDGILQPQSMFLP
jgi:hypothetical protein